MANLIYTNFTIVLATALFVLGLLFLSLRSNMESPVFRTALRMMAFTYCFFGLVNMLELWSRTFLPETEDVLLLQMTTLIVAVSQAFLFTYTLILLINAPFVTRKRVVRELVLLFTVSVALVIAHFTLPAAWGKLSVYLFILFYVYLLIHYTGLFVATYRNCLRKMDNFFSGREAEHLRWVNFSFYAALSIGTLALAVSLFPAIHIGIVCSIIYLVFYFYFAIRFIKHGFVYKKIEEALSDNDDSPPLIASPIETKLKIWLDEKRFLQPGITLNDVSRYVGTNNKYLSVYINQNMDRTFREWINHLRIEEAKRLLLEYPGMNVSDIALRVGFATKSHFGQQFRAVTRFSPSHWRQQAMAE